MATILVTGAAGSIGRKLMAAFTADGHAVTGLDVADAGDPRVARADLAEWDPGWVERLRGIDVVVHLAATPSPDATWEEVARLNVDLTLNVYQAAVGAGVRRVVFASTNWVVAGHRLGEGPLDAATPPRPINAYGASKLFGERAGLSFSRSHGLSVICLRIGAAQTHEGQMPRADGPLGRWGREMWLSDRDLCQGFLKAALAPDGVAFAVLNLMSDNAGMRWSLEPARATTGYVPQDSSLALADAPSRPDEAARAVRAAIEELDRTFHDAEM